MEPTTPAGQIENGDAALHRRDPDMLSFPRDIAELRLGL